MSYNLKLPKQLNIKEKKICRYAAQAKYCMFAGPPFVQAAFHPGTAYTTVLKDEIGLAFFISGKDICFHIGWDCHGYPVEIEIIKMYNIKPTHSAFEWVAKRYVRKAIAFQTYYMLSLGVRPYATYFTSSSSFQKRVCSNVRSLWKKGLIYSAWKPVRWSIALNGISPDAENESHYERIRCWWFPFRVKDKDDVFLLIWTTTPYSLCANSAIAFNPNLRYSRYLYKGSVYVCGRGQFPMSIHEVQELGELDIAEMKTWEYYNLNGLSCRLFPAEWIDDKRGTSLVHIAPIFDERDYSLWEEYRFDFPDPIKTRQFTSFADMDKYADRYYSEVLIERYIEQVVVRSTRSKERVLDYMSRQYFCHIAPLREKAMKYIRSIRWNSPTTVNRAISALNKNDWCISRNRNWNTPLLSKYHSLNPRFEMFRTGRKLGLDVWMDSSSVNHSSQLWIQLEGQDQFRGFWQHQIWLRSSINYKNRIFRIIHHGFLTNDTEEKLSKSKNNYISMEAVLSKYSKDVFRFWAASNSWSKSSVLFTEKVLGEAQHDLKKIKNYINFMMCYYIKGDHRIFRRDDSLECYFLHSCGRFHLYVLRNYMRVSSLHKVQKKTLFFIKEVSHILLDNSKTLLYCWWDSDSFLYRCSVISLCLDVILQSLYPICPDYVEGVISRLDILISDLRGRIKVPNLYVAKEVARQYRVFQLCQQRMFSLGVCEEKVCLILPKSLGWLKDWFEPYKVVEKRGILPLFREQRGLLECKRCRLFYNQLRHGNLCERCSIYVARPE